MIQAFSAFTEKLIIWGGSDVIRAWVDSRVHDWSGNAPVDGLRKLDGFIRAIRKDLGNKNWKLAEGDLIRLFVNDFESFERLEKSDSLPEPMRGNDENTSSISGTSLPQSTC
jgi:hypothetical protein